MLIRYEFDNGDVMEIEVDNYFGKLIEESRTQLETLEREERRYCFSLSRINDKSSWMLSNENNPCDMLEHIIEIMEEEERLKERKRKLYEAIETLSPRQKELINAMLEDNVSQSEFAEMKGISKSTVSEHFAKAKEKIRKFF